MVRLRLCPLLALRASMAPARLSSLSPRHSGQARRKPPSAKTTHKIAAINDIYSPPDANEEGVAKLSESPRSRTVAFANGRRATKLAEESSNRQLALNYPQIPPKTVFLTTQLP
jgi:hypothetical protein